MSEPGGPGGVSGSAVSGTAVVRALPGPCNGSAVGPLALHLSLEGRRVVMIGGGAVAGRKLSACLSAGAAVTVIAPWIGEDVAAAVHSGAATWLRRTYRDGDLGGAWLAFAATGDLSTNRAVQAEATRRRIFCVRVDDGVAGTARTPATARRDGMLISVGTVATPDPRRSAALRSAIGEALDSGGLPLRRHRRRPGPGRVVFVDVGSGDPDLFTVRARRELAGADVVVYDPADPVAVLAELPDRPLLIPVTGLVRDDVSALLIGHAHAGRRVVRLHGEPGEGPHGGAAGRRPGATDERPVLVEPYRRGIAAERAACRRGGVAIGVIPGVPGAPTWAYSHDSQPLLDGLTLPVAVPDRRPMRRPGSPHSTAASM